MEKTSWRAKIGLIAYVTVLNIALVLTVQLVFGSGGSATAALKNAAPKATVVSDEAQVIALAAKASPAVVSIVVERFQAEDDSYQEAARGTGFLVSADGTIVTNRHVVGDRQGKYTVYLADDRKFAAQVLDIDPVNDLALIRIDAIGLPYLEIMTSDDYRVGQTVIAIGNALGKYSNTVTRGILSGVNRSLDAADPRNGSVEQLDEMLQTDAAINSGNSGGPLLDTTGRVIGVNTAVETSGSDLGFAIPSVKVRQALVSYSRFTAITHPRLGVRYVMITPDLAAERELPVSYGASVEAAADLPAVLPNSPAAAAGIKPLDVILEINGQKIAGVETLSRLIQNFNVGDVVRLKVRRADEILSFSVRLDAHLPYGS